MNAVDYSRREKLVGILAGTAPLPAGLIAAEFVDPTLIWGGHGLPPLVLFVSVGAMAIVDSLSD